MPEMAYALAGKVVVAVACHSFPAEVIGRLAELANVVELTWLCLEHPGEPVSHDGRVLYASSDELFSDDGREMAHAAAEYALGEALRKATPFVEGRIWGSARKLRVGFYGAPEAKGRRRYWVTTVES